MEKIVLSELESRILKENDSVTVTRYGFEIVIDVDQSQECGYQITVVNPFEKVIVKSIKEEPVKEVPNNGWLVVLYYDEWPVNSWYFDEREDASDKYRELMIDYGMDSVKTHEVPRKESN